MGFWQISHHYVPLREVADIVDIWIQWTISLAWSSYQWPDKDSDDAMAEGLSAVDWPGNPFSWFLSPPRIESEPMEYDDIDSFKESRQSAAQNAEIIIDQELAEVHWAQKHQKKEFVQHEKPLKTRLVALEAFCYRIAVGQRNERNDSFGDGAIHHERCSQRSRRAARRRKCYVARWGWGLEHFGREQWVDFCLGITYQT
jgi:hypothetical protein